MRKDIPLVCPFCDELAYAKANKNRIVLPHKIYTLRECVMGHEFYSVEYIPEEQSEIAAEIKEIRKDAREWISQRKDS